jgi:hypothetical protein
MAETADTVWGLIGVGMAILTLVVVLMVIF